MSTLQQRQQVEVHSAESSRQPRLVVVLGRQTARARRSTNAALVALVLGVALFAGAFAAYVLHPAVVTLSGPAASDSQSIEAQ